MIMTSNTTSLYNSNNNTSTSKLKASFCKVSMQEKQLFSDSHIMLLISMGNKRQRGKYIAATIDLIKNKFKHYTIMICDVLQRHNLISQLNLSPEDAYISALKEGDNWLDDNFSTLKKLNNFTIVRWSKWIEDNNFNHYRKMIEREYNQNVAYRESIIQTAKIFSNRTSNIQTKDDILNSSITYLLEECSAMFLWVNEGYNYELYPGDRNLAMASTYDLYIKPGYPHVLKAVSLRFK